MYVLRIGRSIFYKIFFATFFLLLLFLFKHHDIYADGGTHGDLSNNTPCDSAGGYCASGNGQAACGGSNGNRWLYDNGWCGTGKACCYGGGTVQNTVPCWDIGTTLSADGFCTTSCNQSNPIGTKYSGGWCQPNQVCCDPLPSCNATPTTSACQGTTNTCSPGNGTQTVTYTTYNGTKSCNQVSSSQKCDAGNLCSPGNTCPAGGGTCTSSGSTNPSPVGNLDSVDCATGIATGWACDSSDYSQPIAIHFYSDPHFQTFVGAAQQISIPRESAVGTQCGGHTNHGFTFQVPSSLKDGNSHTLYAYAINYPTDPSNNPSIGNKSFTCQPAPQHTRLYLGIQLLGIGSTGNLTPKHPIRPVHIQLYKKGDDPTQPNITPVLDSTTQTVTFDSNTGYFLNASLDLGTALPAGDYQILVKTPGYLRKEITDGQGGKVFTLTPGQTTTPPTVQLIAGDVAPLYNEIGPDDFYATVDCYGTKATSSTCAAGSQITDLNDDGVIDGVDLNIWLLGFQAAQASANQSSTGVEIPGDGTTGN